MRWVLGSADSEMKRIFRILLHIKGDTVEMATQGGEPLLTTAQAYGGLDQVGEEEPTAWVECSPDVPGPSDVFLDHHRLGDKGYDVPPEEFLRGSSVGQAISLLAQRGKLLPFHRSYRGPPSGEVGDIVFVGRWLLLTRWGWTTIPQYLVHTAAVDHCPAATYNHACPGVDSETLFRLKVRDPERRESILEAVKVIEATPEVAGLPGVKDLRVGVYVCTGPLRHWRHHVVCPTCGTNGTFLTHSTDLKIACLYSNIPVVHGFRRRGRFWWLLNGCGVGSKAGPDPVRRFLDEWGPGNGLEEMYGNPFRGFAAGRVPLRA